jgi:uncharacterized SAM-dependent methyltransferase
MLYFKHSELVNNYHVSLKTVHNWIDSAKQGKLELQLHEHNGRTYVANTPTNLVALADLADKGKKYRNNLHHKIVTPKPEFYDLYSPRQILDIISNLTIHREIPRQYNYMDGGASNWDRYTQRLWQEDNSNLLKSTINLINSNLQDIDRLLEGAKKINVVDIGPGNAFPVKTLLEHLLSKGLLNRYVAIDISESMLEIAAKNIKEWFDGRVSFEGYVRDFTYEQFDDVLVDDMLGAEADTTINLALLLGATPMNCRAPYDAMKVIRHSLGQKDLLIYSDKPDTELDRRYFNFNPEPNSAVVLSPNHSFIFDLLNIDESLYDVEMGFNEQKRIRFIRVRLRSSLAVDFRLDKGERRVDLQKGDTILLWRAWHQTTLELISGFEEIGLTLLQASLTQDRQYLLTISGVSTDSTGEV